VTFAPAAARREKKKLRGVTSAPLLL
jgi:hypothetical protein